MHNIIEEAEKAVRDLLELREKQLVLTKALWEKHNNLIIYSTFSVLRVKHEMSEDEYDRLSVLSLPAIDKLYCQIPRDIRRLEDEIKSIKYSLNRKK